MDTTKIRQLNDALRTTLKGGKILVTSGFSALPVGTKADAYGAIVTFDKFDDENNDPYKEHDFGAVEIDGEKIFWKIDYYDKSMEAGSEDPSDPSQTTRVLTIMLAEEY